MKVLSPEQLGALRETCGKDQRVSERPEWTGIISIQSCSASRSSFPNSHIDIFLASFLGAISGQFEFGWGEGVGCGGRQDAAVELKKINLHTLHGKPEQKHQKP